MHGVAIESSTTIPNEYLYENVVPSPVLTIQANSSKVLNFSKKCGMNFYMPHALISFIVKKEL